MWPERNLIYWYHVVTNLLTPPFGHTNLLRISKEKAEFSPPSLVPLLCLLFTLVPISAPWTIIIYWRQMNSVYDIMFLTT